MCNDRLCNMCRDDSVPGHLCTLPPEVVPMMMSQGRGLNHVTLSCTQPALEIQMAHSIPQALAGAAGMKRGRAGCNEGCMPKEKETQRGPLLRVSEGAWK